MHFKSFRVMSTEVIEAPSSETVSFIVPLLAFSLISMGPLKVAPGLGAAGLARVAVGLGAAGVAKVAPGLGVAGAPVGAQAVKRITASVAGKSQSLSLLIAKSPFKSIKGQIAPNVLGTKKAVHSLVTSFLDYTVPLGERAPGRVGSLYNDITANGLFNCYYPTRFSIDYYRQTGCFLSNL
ncbi:MAG: hypothetical protein AB1649_31475, partial [Chloroflexota bacterium]